MEVWKKIDGFNYEVSNTGKIRNSRSGKLLKPKVEKSGYFRVTLFNAGERTCESVHILVLEAFVGPRPGDSRQIHGCHRDGNPANNTLSNLRWDTVSANHADKICHGTDFDGEKNPSVKLGKSQVTEIRDRLKSAKWGDVSRLAKEYGVDQTTISDIKTGRSWSSI